MTLTETSNQSNEIEDEILIVAPICSIFRRFLKNRGLKFTAERAAILDTVLEKESLFLAEELLDNVRDAGHRVSKATIYRTIKHLVEAGIIQEVLIESTQAHYQLIYGRKPKDHMVNVDTDEVIPFDPPQELLDLINRMCEEKGMKPAGHRFLIYGVKNED